MITITHYFVIFESLAENTKMAPHKILHSFIFNINPNATFSSKRRLLFSIQQSQHRPRKYSKYESNDYMNSLQSESVHFTLKTSIFSMTSSISVMQQGVAEAASSAGAEAHGAAAGAGLRPTAASPEGRRGRGVRGSWVARGPRGHPHTPCLGLLLVGKSSICWLLAFQLRVLRQFVVWKSVENQNKS